MRECCPRVGILADDLTSAADGAAPFVARGMRAGIGRNTLPVPEREVEAVDCGSRSLSATAAAARVSELTRQLAKCRILYKTVDSTLRGHITLELEAAYAQSGRKSVVFAPAFPAAGRTTVNGVQLVNGVPVSQTLYARDPSHPARTAVLAELIPAALRDVLLLDAATQEELDARVAALPNPEKALWVGSPGMAQALARRIGAESCRLQDGLAMSCGEILVAIGTANPMSHRQARRLAGLRGVVCVAAPLERRESPDLVLEEIAAHAATRLATGTFGALLAAGGETTAAILDRLNVRQLEVLGELEPGFPLALAALADGRALLIAMKAGGFGDEATLVNAVARLERAPPTTGQKTA